jgi:hypothetical protein
MLTTVPGFGVSVTETMSWLQQPGIRVLWLWSSSGSHASVERVATIGQLMDEYADANVKGTKTEWLESYEKNKLWGIHGIPDAAAGSYLVVYQNGKVLQTLANKTVAELREVLRSLTIVATPVDTTDDLKGTCTARGQNDGAGEVVRNLFDNQAGTKWLDLSPTGSWVQYAYAAGIAGRLTGYTLTSGGDAPERDPATWQLVGSNDGGSTWVTVDSQTSVTFSSRLQKLSFTVTGAPAYKAYRLNIASVFSPSTANCVQLAEIELLGQQVAG